jgi:hypothetical protein
LPFDYIIRGSRLAFQHPGGTISRLSAYLDKRRDRREWDSLGRSAIDLYGCESDWDERLHERLGAAYPCGEKAAIDEVWKTMVESVGVRGEGDPSHAQIALQFDACPSFTLAVWCATRHLYPDTVVETGVARGITSRALLEALDRNQNGHLWSIDLPHPANDQLGSAVTDSLKARWTLRLGTSQELLPKLLGELGEIDIFVHDSLHTGRNVAFELGAVWDHLRPGGVLFADDLHHSLGFHRFVQKQDVATWFAAPRGDGGLWGMAQKL